MRNIDAVPLEQALEALHNVRQRDTEDFHQLETLRDDILAAGVDGVELAMARFSRADRQQLRQLVLQHQREQLQHKPPAASRKLFRYLKEQQEAYGESEPAGSGTPPPV